MNKTSVGFEGKVDGQLAADFIAVKDNINHHVNIDQNNAFTNLLERVNALNAGEKALYMAQPTSMCGPCGCGVECGGDPTPAVPAVIGSCTGGSSSNIYVYDCLGLAETSVHLPIILGLLIGILLPISGWIITKFMGENPALITSLFLTAAGANLVPLLLEWWNNLSNIDNFLAFIAGLTAFFDSIFTYLSFELQLVFIISLSVELAETPGRLAQIALAILSLAVLLNEVGKLNTDLADTDDYIYT